MSARLAPIVALLLAAGSPLLAQNTAGAASASTSAGSQFRTGALYAGPRLWLGNLNGSMAIGGQVERGITQPGAYGPGIIAGGVGVDYYSWSFAYPTGKYSYSVIPLQAFGNYHFVLKGKERFDPYVGLAFVYSVVNASWSGSGVAASANASGATFAGQAGMRYFLSEKVALQGQLGFGYGTLGLGASWRF
jgi:hypothetical protein